MKRFYKWFDYFLNLVLVSLFIALSLDIYLYANNNNNPAWSHFFPKEAFVLTILLLLTFVFGLLYIILGIILWVINARKWNVLNVSFAKRMLLKGILRTVLAFVLFFIFSLALSFFGLSLSNEPGLPGSIGDSNNSDTGFPIKDLQIISRKSVPSGEEGNGYWGCDLKIRNNNSNLSAANLSLIDEFTKITYQYVTFRDHISPGQTYGTSIEMDTTDASECNNISISAAGIVKR